MKKKLALIAVITLTHVDISQACRNTISNNTNDTYKIAEIRQENKNLKQELYLPDDYLNDEQKAHTLKPGEEVSFGGHYLPTFAIFKEYPDKKWHLLVIVKQNECGPRGPENKYLLLTDVLKCELPDDYNPVYTFIRRKTPQELETESKNTKELTVVANPYQELQNILDEMTQKIMELMSKLIEKCATERCAAQPDKEKVTESSTDEHNYHDHGNSTETPAAETSASESLADDNDAYEENEAGCTKCKA